MDFFRPATAKEQGPRPATVASTSMTVWNALTRVHQFLCRRIFIMALLKRMFFVAIGLALVMVVSACGGTTSTGSTPSTPTAAATPTTASASTVQTAQAMVGGKTTTIFTNAQGKTLYYFTPDTATTSACTGSCADNWPPLLVTSGTPTSATTLPGKLSAQTTTNGNQVAYNGHFLYTFAADSGPDRQSPDHC